MEERPTECPGSISRSTSGVVEDSLLVNMAKVEKRISAQVAVLEEISSRMQKDSSVLANFLSSLGSSDIMASNAKPVPVRPHWKRSNTAHALCANDDSDLEHRSRGRAISSSLAGTGCDIFAHGSQQKRFDTKQLWRAAWNKHMETRKAEEATSPRDLNRRGHTVAHSRRQGAKSLKSTMALNTTSPTSPERCSSRSHSVTSESSEVESPHSHKTKTASHGSEWDEPHDGRDDRSDAAKFGKVDGNREVPRLMLAARSSLASAMNVSKARQLWRRVSLATRQPTSIFNSGHRVSSFNADSVVPVKEEYRPRLSIIEDSSVLGDSAKDVSAVDESEGTHVEENSNEVGEQGDGSARASVTSSVTTLSCNFEIRTVWKNLKASSGRRLKKDDSVGMATYESIDATESRRERSCYVRSLKPLMTPPTSMIAVSWDILGMLFICYDFITLPLLAFEQPESAFKITMEWIVRMFWTLTIPRTLVVGYMRPDGFVVMDPKDVLRAYVVKWLGFDVVIVACDWAAIIMEGMSFVGTMRITKVIRLLRFMRIIRMARVMKMPALANQVLERFHSEKLLLLLGIAMISTLFVGLVHIVACSWYALGAAGFQDQGWVAQYISEEETFGYRYATSMHWAVTQYIGSMEVYPLNVLERIFAVIVLIFSFIVSAAFVSQITAKMTRLQIISETAERQFSKLRQFLQHHRIQSTLVVQVVRSARHALKMREKNIIEADIELLQNVSEPLRVEIHYKIHSGLLTEHPFFREINNMSLPTMRQLCHTAVDVVQVQACEFVFGDRVSPGEPRMFFVMSGSLKYEKETTYSKDASSTLGNIGTTVQQGQWAGEAALWQKDMLQWIGSMECLEDSNILMIDTDSLIEIISASTTPLAIRKFTSSYAEHFLTLLNEKFGNRHWQDVGDLDDCESIVTLASQTINIRGSVNSFFPLRRFPKPEL